MFIFWAIMRSILVFNDNSKASENAAEFALCIAKKAKADLLVLNLCKVFEPKMKEKQPVIRDVHKQSEPDTGGGELVENLTMLAHDDEFTPVVWDIDVSSYNDQEICALVTRKNIWMMVKGIDTILMPHEYIPHINVQSVLNHVSCPLLLVPDGYKKYTSENIAYTVDMRYCRIAVIKFLDELARYFKANLIIEHLSANGLTPLDDHYADDLFNAAVLRNTKYEKIHFNNIKERDMNVALDVIVNGLHADLLAIVNHRSHFEAIFGMRIGDVLPAITPVPVLVFPY